MEGKVLHVNRIYEIRFIVWVFGEVKVRITRDVHVKFADGWIAVLAR